MKKIETVAILGAGAVGSYFIYGLNEKFGEDFMYGELYELFKDEVDKEDLKVLLEDMGHDFVDLDELDEEEKERYF